MSSIEVRSMTYSKTKNDVSLSTLDDDVKTRTAVVGREERNRLKAKGILYHSKLFFVIKKVCKKKNLSWV